jgi:uncharacterized membrane protein YeaQ/YmgE (transglycosylase-associated protein family)
MHIVWTIVIGFFAGLIAKWVMPGKERMGIIMTVILGVVGSVVATYLGKLLKIYEPGETAGFIGAVVGSIIILAIYSFLKKKTA